VLGAIRDDWVFKCMEITQIVPYAGWFRSRYTGQVRLRDPLDYALDPA
jgi:hypothetical protein